MEEISLCRGTEPSFSFSMRGGGGGGGGGGQQQQQQGFLLSTRRAFYESGQRSQTNTQMPGHQPC